MNPKPPRKKKCKQCGNVFQPTRSIQPVCDSYECKVKYAEAHALKANNKRKAQEAIKKRARRAETKKAKDDAKNLTEWLNDAQKPFNRLIKLRDADQPCISCGTTKNVQYAAGHFRTVKAASHLRFNEDNVHKQCNSYCNRHLSGNIINYRPALIDKIGIERFEAIECNNEVKRWTIEEAKAIKAHYTERCKALIKLKGE